MSTQSSQLFSFGFNVGLMEGPEMLQTEKNKSLTVMVTGKPQASPFNSRHTIIFAIGSHVSIIFTANCSWATLTPDEMNKRRALICVLSCYVSHMIDYF